MSLGEEPRRLSVLMHHPAAIAAKLSNRSPEFSMLYGILLRETYHEQTKEKQDERHQLLGQARNYEQRIFQARDLVATGNTLEVG